MLCGAICVWCFLLFNFVYDNEQFSLSIIIEPFGCLSHYSNRASFIVIELYSWIVSHLLAPIGYGPRSSRSRSGLKITINKIVSEVFVGFEGKRVDFGKFREMSSTHSMRIEALGKDNFDTWKLLIQVKALLVKNDANYVSGEKNVSLRSSKGMIMLLW